MHMYFGDPPCPSTVSKLRALTTMESWVQVIDVTESRAKWSKRYMKLEQGGAQVIMYKVTCGR